MLVKMDASAAGENIDLTQAQSSFDSTTTNITSFTGLDTNKYYCVFAYQYSPYSNWHGFWTDADLKTALGTEARLLGSYKENTSSYCITSIIFKPQSSSIDVALGFRAFWFPIT